MLHRLENKLHTECYRFSLLDILSDMFNDLMLVEKELHRITGPRLADILAPLQVFVIRYFQQLN